MQGGRVVNKPTKKLGQGCSPVRHASSNCRSLRCLAGSRRRLHAVRRRGGHSRAQRLRAPLCRGPTPPPPACSPLPARAGRGEGRVAALTGSGPTPLRPPQHRGEARTPPPAQGVEGSAGPRPRTLRPQMNAERWSRERGAGKDLEVVRGGVAQGSSFAGEELAPGRGIERDSAPKAGRDGAPLGLGRARGSSPGGVSGGGAGAALGE